MEPDGLAREPGPLPVARLSTTETVVPRAEKGVHHVGADEAGSPRHQDPHRTAPDFRYHSMVWRNPLSTSTRGSQPSRLRARVMSGWRTLGSSAGSGMKTSSLREPASLTIIWASASSVISYGLPRLTGSLTGLFMSRQMPSTRSE